MQSPQSTSMTSQEAALAYVKKGWAVIDIPYGKKEPYRGGWQRERWTEEQVADRFSEPKNPAILLGEPSGLIDVDLDYLPAGKYAHLALPTTPATFGRDGKPKSHWLYNSNEPFRGVKFSDPVEKKSGGVGTLLEVRGTGQYTVFPGGVHSDTGEEIRWESEGEPAEVKVDELVKAASRYAAMLLLSTRLGEGTRHEKVLPLAGGLLRSGWRQDDVEEFLRRVCILSGGDFVDWQAAIESTARALDNEDPTTGWPTLAEHIGEEVVRSIKKWLGVTDATDRPKLTDMGNAQRLIERHGSNLRYCAAWSKWLIWDGKRWAVDDNSQIERWAKDTVRAIFDEAKEAQDPEAARLVGRWASASQMGNRVAAMIHLARSEEGVAIRPTDLDTDPWLLNLENGTLDLTTFELRPWQRDDLVTKLAPVSYFPDVKCPVWDAFLLKAFKGSSQLVEYVQRLIGYSLTGDTREKALPIAWGPGDTGKTTFTETVLALLDEDYAVPTPESTIAAKKHAGGIPNDLARLKGIRLVVVSETAEGMLLDEGRVKALTGRNKISARFLHAEWFDFIPEFKLLIETNNRPRIRESGTAIWNRVKLIPFEVVIPKEEQDKELGAKLKAEMAGILTWAVEGCQRWQAEGLVDPEEVKTATEDFRDDSDIVGEFIEELTVVGPGLHVQTSALYAAFKSWVVNERGAHPPNQQTFNERMEVKGFKRVKVSSMRWNGLRLFMSPKEEESEEGTG